MRRWMKFGQAGNSLIYTPSDDDQKLYVSMQHKPQMFEILSTVFGTNSQEQDLMWMPLYFFGDNNPFNHPAPDCNAYHLTDTGYAPIAGFSPLSNYFFNGFINRQLTNTPPIFLLSGTEPDPLGG